MKKIRGKGAGAILWKGFQVLLLAIVLAVGCMGHMAGGDMKSAARPQMYAWWGTLYPEFCFEKGEDAGESKTVKLSFWLAKALDRW